MLRRKNGVLFHNFVFILSHLILSVCVEGYNACFHRCDTCICIGVINFVNPRQIKVVYNWSYKVSSVMARYNIPSSNKAQCSTADTSYCSTPDTVNMLDVKCLNAMFEFLDTHLVSNYKEVVWFANS